MTQKNKKSHFHKPPLPPLLLLFLVAFLQVHLRYIGDFTYVTLGNAAFLRTVVLGRIYLEMQLC